MDRRRGVGGALSDRLLALVGAVPAAFERLVSAALARRVVQGPVAIVTALGLLLLTLGPMIAFGVELIVTPTTISDLVERRTNSTTTVVEFDGFALLLPLAAERPPGARASAFAAYRWLAVHDDLTDPQFALVRTPLDPDALLRRDVVARLIRDPNAVAIARAAFAARGVAADPNLAGVLLDEVDQVDPRDEVRTISSLADAATLPDAEIVRIRLYFSGIGVATCAADDSCDARRLAGGAGPWDQLASDPTSGTPIMVRTSYPPSVAPFAGVGRQARDQVTVDRFLALPWVDGLIGWTRLLRLAHVEQDLSLPVHRDWTGPLLFAAAAGLLLAGARLGYPRFRVDDASIRRWSGARRWTEGREVPVRVTGHALSERVDVDLDGAPGTVRALPDDAGAEVAVTLPTGPLRITIPRAVAGLGTVESGWQVEVRRSRPGLRVGWFGSQVLLLFASADERDRVADLVRVAH